MTVTSKAREKSFSPLPTKPQSFHLPKGETRCSSEAIMRWASSRGRKKIFRRGCAGSRWRKKSKVGLAETGCPISPRTVNGLRGSSARRFRDRLFDWKVTLETIKQVTKEQDEAREGGRIIASERFASRNSAETLRFLLSSGLQDRGHSYHPNRRLPYLLQIGPKT